MSHSHSWILAVSPDQNILHIRHEAIRRAGYDVVSVRTQAEARYEVQLGRCGVLVLCHKLSRASRNDLSDVFFGHCPAPYIIAVIAQPGDHLPAKAHIAVLHSEDCAALIRALAARAAA